LVNIVDENITVVLVAAAVAFVAAFAAALLTSETVRKHGMVGSLRRRFSSSQRGRLSRL
jgi:hypothetical protein